MSGTHKTDHWPLVSIGIPTYNRADGYLRECIESARSQSYSNIEIVISDNCSSDGTADLVRSINDSRIRYFRHEKNIGANNNFNYCLEQARGDYFLLLHDDDLIDSDFVQACMEAAGYQLGIGLVRTGTRLIDQNGQSFRERPNRAAGLSPEDFFLGWFDSVTTLYLCSSLFNTAHLKELGGFSSRHNLFQDVVAEVQLAAKYRRVDVEAVKASFRKHKGEITFQVKVKAWCEDSLDLLDLMCDLAKEKKQLIRAKGHEYFAQLNFNRAMAVSSLVGRVRALMTVLNEFGFHRSSVRRRFYRCLRATASELVRKRKLDSAIH